MSTEETNERRVFFFVFADENNLSLILPPQRPVWEARNKSAQEQENKNTLQTLGVAFYALVISMESRKGKKKIVESKGTEIY